MDRMVVVVLCLCSLVFARVCGGAPLQTVQPKETIRAFRNPGKGWVAYVFAPAEHPNWSSAGERLHPYVDLVYCNYFSWAMLEPREGVYRWDLIDRFVAHWSSEPYLCKIGIGIHVTDNCIPGTYEVPEWLVNTPGMDGTYYTRDVPPQVSSARNYEPSYHNRLFLDRLGRFIKAFGERYRATRSWQEKIECVDIATYGMWGEWHSDKYQWPDAQTQKATLTEMVDQFARAFPHSRQVKPKLTMNVVSYASLGGLENNAVRHAIEDVGAQMFRRGMGWPEALSKDEVEFMQLHWKKAKLYGEWGSTDGSIKKFPGGMTTEQAIKHALSLHTSTLGWLLLGDPLETAKESETHETLLDYFQKRCGYRLVLRKASFPKFVKPGGTLELQQEWAQIGSARMYDRFYLRAYLVGQKRDYAIGIYKRFDATSWVNDGQRHRVMSLFGVPKSIPPGRYELRIALVDPVNGKPAVNLAIEGKDVADPNRFGRYRLGSVTVQPYSRQLEYSAHSTRSR